MLILFFVVFKLPFKNVIKGIILMSLFTLGFVMKVGLTTDWYINYFCFPLGVLISLCGGGIAKKYKKNHSGIISLGFCCNFDWVL